MSPIVIFVYNRVNLLRNTINSLLLNPESEFSTLIIFSDGPKPNSTDQDLQKIIDVRKYCKSISGFKSVSIIERSENLGLACSIIVGVTDCLKMHDSIIILEDDLLVSKSFLKYMNDGINKFKNSLKVVSVHAFNYPIETKNTKEAFFIRGADCLGWATWRNGWSCFRENGLELAHELFEKNLVRQFNFNNTVNFSGMLMDQIIGRNNSWAIRWYASAFLAEKLTLYPSKTLINHIGLDSEATHSSSTDHFNDSLAEIGPEYFPKEEIHNDFYYALISDFFKRNRLNDKHKPIKLLYGKKYTIKKKIKNVLKKKSKQNYGWNGSYSSWDEAKLLSEGYQKKSIAEICFEATRKVINGDAIFDRDGVAFHNEEFNWPLITNLLLVGTEKNNSIVICDFGGGFGSSYLQHRKLLNNIMITWKIVEQREYVDLASNLSNVPGLSFFKSIKSAFENSKPNILLLSSVLQYLENPYSWLEYFIALQCDYILIDRTAFINHQHERITVQTVPPEIYSASYPCYFFNENKFLSKFEGMYNLVTDFASYCDAPKTTEDGVKLFWKGFLLKRSK